MHSLPKALVLLAVLLPLPAFAVKGYLCVVEYSAGLAYNKATKTWQAVTFKPAGSFLIAPAEGNDVKLGRVWTIKQLGSSAPLGHCKADFNKVGMMVCETSTGEFMLNNKNNRFISSYMSGYFNEEVGDPKYPEGDETPSIKAGTCSSL